MKSYKNILLVIICWLGMTNLKAQQNPAVAYSEHFQVQRAAFQPSFLGSTGDKFEFGIVPLNLLNLHVWGGAQNIGFGPFLDISDAPTNADIDNLLSNLDENNRAGFGLKWQPLYTAFQISKKTDSVKTELFTLSLELNVRAEGNLNLLGAVFDILWNGNEDYVGQNVSGDFELNLLSMGELALGGAADVYKKGNNKVRVGLRLKYLYGLAGIYTENGSLNLTTAGTGNTVDSIVVRPDYRINVVGFADDEFENAGGSGFGVDLGGTFYYGDNWQFSASLLDIGAVRFSTNVTNYVSNGEAASFDGVEVDPDGNDNSEAILDELENDINGEETKESFSMPLPTRMILQAQYSMPCSNGNEHRFFATYTQGFRNMGIATTRPLMTLAYVYAVKDKFNVGVVPTFLGYNSASLGTFISYKAGIFKTGIGTSNLISAITAGESGRSADLSINLGLTF